MGALGCYVRKSELDVEDLFLGSACCLVENVRPGDLLIDWKLETIEELWQSKQEMQVLWGSGTHNTCSSDQNAILCNSATYRSAAQNSLISAARETEFHSG